MFRTIKFSSSGSLYKQLYGTLSCIYRSSLVPDRMCFILRLYKQSSLRQDVFDTHTSCQGLDFLYRCMIKYRKAACTDFLMMKT